MFVRLRKTDAVNNKDLNNKILLYSLYTFHIQRDTKDRRIMRRMRFLFPFVDVASLQMGFISFRS